MDTPTMIIVILAGTLIAVFIAVVAAALIWLVFRQAKTKKLRQKFGPEYDYTMETVGNRRTTEEMLSEREKRVEDLAIRTLDPQEQEHYRQEWVDIQSNFVDSPSESVDKANKLITEVMIARGFPVADFEQRAADISVFYPNFVSDYRNAYAIAVKNQNKDASTEELRQSMVYYRSLYQELLGEQVLVGSS